MKSDMCLTVFQFIKNKFFFIKIRPIYFDVSVL